MVKTNANSRVTSAQSSRTTSPPRQQLDMSQLQSTLTQLTAAVSLLAEGHLNQQKQQAPATVVVGPPPDPNFDWNKLVLPPLCAFPPTTEGQVQQIADALFSRVHNLQGRLQHEIRFVLSMASQYPNLSAEAQDIVYQRLNFYYIVIYHGWNAAIQASKLNTASNSLAVLPEGFVFPTSSPRFKVSRSEHSTPNNSFDKS